MLLTRVRNLWGLEGDFEAIDLGYGFVCFKFNNPVDCIRLYSGGPWIIMDHYLTVRRWEPEFRPVDADEVSSTGVWIRIHQCPLKFYYEKVLFAIGKKVGKPIKVDANTISTSKGRYARTCVWRSTSDNPSNPNSAQVLKFMTLNMNLFTHYSFLVAGLSTWKINVLGIQSNRRPVKRGK